MQTRGPYRLDDSTSLHFAILFLNMESLNLSSSTEYYRKLKTCTAPFKHKQKLFPNTGKQTFQVLFGKHQHTGIAYKSTVHPLTTANGQQHLKAAWSYDQGRGGCTQNPNLLLPNHRISDSASYN